MFAFRLVLGTIVLAVLGAACTKVAPARAIEGRTEFDVAGTCEELPTAEQIASEEASSAELQAAISATLFESGLRAAHCGKRGARNMKQFCKSTADPAPSDLLADLELHVKHIRVADGTDLGKLRCVVRNECPSKTPSDDERQLDVCDDRWTREEIVRDVNYRWDHMFDGLFELLSDGPLSSPRGDPGIP